MELESSGINTGDPLSLRELALVKSRGRSRSSEINFKMASLTAVSNRLNALSHFERSMVDTYFPPSMRTATSAIKKDGPVIEDKELVKKAEDIVGGVFSAMQKNLKKDRGDLKQDG